MDLFAVLGAVGGIISIFVEVASYLITPVAELSFNIHAIYLLFEIKSKNAIKTASTFDMIKLIFGLCPDKQLKKLYELGSEKLSERLDFIYLSN